MVFGSSLSLFGRCFQCALGLAQILGSVLQVFAGDIKNSLQGLHLEDLALQHLLLGLDEILHLLEIFRIQEDSILCLGGLVKNNEILWVHRGMKP